MALLSLSGIWEELDLCESYLVHCEFEKAASLSSSIITRLESMSFAESLDDIQFADMIESAAMLFVQSLKELGRTQELFIELKLLFASVEAIPAEAFLTGASMQLAENYSSNLQVILEEFLSKWKYAGEVYILIEAESQNSMGKKSLKQSMSAEKYIRVAEIYTITFLGMVIHNPKLAISWAEKAELPEESRQDILRRLLSLSCTAESSLSPGCTTNQKPDQAGNGIDGLKPSEYFSKVAKSQSDQNGDQLKASPLISNHPRIQRITDQLKPCFLWFRNVHLRFGNKQVAIPRGKFMFLGSLMALMYYILLKKNAVLKRIVAGQASSVRRAIVDALQLAFSFQVNPLAAVQQLPAPHARR